MTEFINGTRIPEWLSWLSDVISFGKENLALAAIAGILFGITSYVSERACAWLHRTYANRKK